MISFLHGVRHLLWLSFIIMLGACTTAPQQPQSEPPQPPYVLERSDLPELVQFGDYFGGLSEPQQHAMCASFNVRESRTLKADVPLLLHLLVARGIYDDCTDLQLLLAKTSQISTDTMKDASSRHFLSMLRRALLKRQEMIVTKVPKIKPKKKGAQKSVQGMDDKNTLKKNVDQAISQPASSMDPPVKASLQQESSSAELEHARVMKKLEAIRAMEKKIDSP